MNARYYIAFAAILIIASSVCANEKVIENNAVITKSQAIEIAREKVRTIGKEYGFDAENMEVSATIYRTPENRYLPSDAELYSEELRKYYRDIKNKLKDKEYWAVRFKTPKSDKGGAVYVFIDARRGEVIHAELAK